MPVTGLSCCNCALAIESRVSKLSGIADAHVDFASEKLTVVFNPDELGVKEIIASVKQVGYGVAIGKTELPITGMQDQTDVILLEKILNQINGVLTANVSYTTERATLEYIPGMTSIAELASAIRKAGFDLVEADTAEEMEDVETKMRSSELQKQKKRMILGLLFTVPLIIFSMARDFKLVGFNYDLYVMLFAATIVQFVVGWQFYVGAFNSLRYGRANMDVLIMLGSSVAYFSGLLVTIGIIHSTNVYFETGAAIITLIRVGKYLEAGAKGKTSEALKALMGLRAKTATVVRNGVEEVVNIELVVIGDTVVVRPGEKVPVDGIISEGRSAIEESMITGESMPVIKGPGDEVIGSTINRDGLIKFEATKVGKKFDPGTNYSSGTRGPRKQSTHSETDRRNRKIFCPHHYRDCLVYFPWMDFYSRDWLDECHDESHCGACYCLSLCYWTGYPNCHYGRHIKRCRKWDSF